MVDGDRSRVVNREKPFLASTRAANLTLSVFESETGEASERDARYGRNTEMTRSKHRAE